MRDAHNSLSLLLRFLLVCTALVWRAPVAHSPIVRTSSPLPPNPPNNYYNTTIINHCDNKVHHHHQTQPNEILGPSLSAMSKARVYTDVNVLRPKEYWDYESLAVQWG